MTISVLYATFADQAEAKRVARTLVEEGLIACANLLPAGLSVYQWQDQVTEETEYILIAKTDHTKIDQAIARLAALHAYDVPCITSWPVTAGHGPYLDWVESEVS